MCCSLIFPLAEKFYKNDIKILREPTVITKSTKPFSLQIEEGKQPETTGEKKDASEILVIEENPELSGYIVSLLRGDYNIISVDSVKEAWARIRVKLPNLIICDQKLQCKSILNFCKRIKKIRSLNHIPFLLITSIESEENKIESYSSGVDAYVVKPFVPELLKARIKNLLIQQKTNPASVSHGINQISILGSDEKLLIKINESVQKRISDPKLNVESLGKEVGLSRVQFYRKIKELTGLTAVEYIRSLRIEVAANILRQGKLSIKEVAGLTGFSDLDYFRTQFKKKFGIAPSTFMEMERKKSH
jgi:DNA-binding response OmpR family regulator